MTKTKESIRWSKRLNLKLAKFPQTDLGNVERFVARVRGRLLWCPNVGWYCWDGKRWTREGAEESVQDAEHRSVRAIQDEAQAVANSAHDVTVIKNGYRVLTSKTLADWGRASENVARLRAISRSAKSYLTIDREKFDADPFKFNVANGTLIFRKTKEGGYAVERRPHHPRDLITKCSPVVYDPRATCPTFDRVFAQVQPDPEQRRFLKQWYGVSLTGDVSNQTVCAFLGSGRNGKSTTISLMSHILGDYSASLPIESFLYHGTGRRAAQASPDLAVLPGVRHLCVSEPNRGAKLDEALLKLITGGDELVVRNFYRGYFGFRPQLKMTISGNHRPEIRDTSESIWRRVKLILWPVQIAEGDVDPSLPFKLRDEASGVLNRLTEGLKDWFKNGLVLSESIIQETSKYRYDGDSVGRFLADCVQREQGSRVQSSAMYAAAAAWSDVNGMTRWNDNWLAEQLQERGYEKRKASEMYWFDVKLTPLAERLRRQKGRT